MFLMSCFIQALEHYSVVHNSEFKYLSCWHIIKEQPMMADHEFGKVRKAKQIQLVSPNASSALSLQNVRTSVTPTVLNPANTFASRPPSTPVNVSTAASVRANVVRTPIADVPNSTIAENIDSRESGDSCSDVEFHEMWNSFFDTSDLDNAVEYQAESSILSAATTTPVVESNTSAVDTSTSTVRLAVVPVTSSMATNTAEAHDEEQNIETDIGGPKNLVGTKRAKRMRALEKETQEIRATVEKMNKSHAATMNECLEATKSEVREQFQEFSVLWSKLLGINTDTIENLRRDLCKEQLIQKTMPETCNQRSPLVEPWIENGLFEGACVTYVIVQFLHWCDWPLVEF